MAEPWINPDVFGPYFGGIGGSLGGVFCGTWGAAVGLLAPRGKAKTLIVGFGWFILAVGVGALGLGLVALVAGQPYGIWYAPLLAGFVVTVVTGILLPMVYLRYHQADLRKLQAVEFRQEGRNTQLGDGKRGLTPES
jgi:hypothetical protein